MIWEAWATSNEVRVARQAVNSNISVSLQLSPAVWPKTEYIVIQLRVHTLIHNAIYSFLGLETSPLRDFSYFQIKAQAEAGKT